MDNIEDAETAAKISDSAYSTSCSNSQSRRSHSSKSTHSGSNSSGSSGYGGGGGKPSTLGSSNNIGQLPKKEKETKKKKKLPPIETAEANVVAETEVNPPEPAPVFDAPKEEICDKDVVPTSPPVHPQADISVENMEVCTTDRNSIKDEVVAVFSVPAVAQTTTYVTGPNHSYELEDGFSCVISMHDGVVMYTTTTLTAVLGFPKDMWIGRSFIDFIHPKDRTAFASQITNGLAVPKNSNSTQVPAQWSADSVYTMVCRIRKYRGLSTGFGVTDRSVTYVPFLLKLNFKNISVEEGNTIYLIIQATVFTSAFKLPHESVAEATTFVLRHTASGNIEYMDHESVPYLGYLPQDLINTNALHLYHPEDLGYMSQVYQIIVKEGGLPKSKAYRMLTQNGDYVKLETEWTSIINPWTKKLEFVIGKHNLLEGPANPDVLQVITPDKVKRVSEEVNKRAAALRDSIIRIMNEVPTKPADIAKQQMSKRCQDLAVFMESLVEDPPKVDDELRVEILDPENIYYERDSVMLGGLSPHHDCNDDKSSTETPLSYTQLNYNETLQRYFDSHNPCSYDDYNTATGENILGMRDANVIARSFMTPLAHSAGASVEIPGTSQSNFDRLNDCGIQSSYCRLTESLINKHNSEMEKELMKIHRECRTSYKGDRAKATNEKRQKKKEHLARCNASYQPTAAGDGTPDSQKHGVKRASKYVDSESKHHCPSPRPSSRHTRKHGSTPIPALIPPPMPSTALGGPGLPSPTVNNMNAFFVGVGFPQQMTFMSPVANMPAMFPIYYAPVPMTTPTNGTTTPNTPPQVPVPCMMYGQPIYGTPFLIPTGSQIAFPIQPTMMPPPLMHTNTTQKPLSLGTSNYEERKNGCRRIQNNSFTNSDETKTDGESSYSSFYSSFFKTESGSAEESSDAKKMLVRRDNSYRSHLTGSSSNDTKPAKRFPKRKMDPPWMDKVSVTSELIYKYQVLSKSIDEVLTADKQKLKALEQSSLVNDQLGQLYLDLQLEGVASRLTLEEGITSSSSSGEETISNPARAAVRSSRRKREYSKLMMIYEEDAPMPSPDPEIQPKPCSSTSYAY